MWPSRQSPCCGTHPLNPMELLYTIPFTMLTMALSPSRWDTNTHSTHLMRMLSCRAHSPVCERALIAFSSSIENSSLELTRPCLPWLGSLLHSDWADWRHKLHPLDDLQHFAGGWRDQDRASNPVCTWWWSVRYTHMHTSTHTPKNWVQRVNSY